jgi:hypothetical protein
MLVGLLLFACTCAGPTGPREVRFAPGVPRSVGGRFVGADEVSLDPRVAFDVQARCPALQRALVERVAAGANQPDVLSVRVEGERLAAVRRVNAGLPDGTLVEVQFVREDDGLRFPVMCDRCEVWFGVDANQRPPDARVVFGGTPSTPNVAVAPATGPGAFAERAGRVGEPASSNPTERATGVARESGLREGESEAGRIHPGNPPKRATGVARDADFLESDPEALGDGAPGPRAFAQRTGGVEEPDPRNPTERATGVARVAACFGDGYSLRFEGGRIVE